MLTNVYYYHIYRPYIIGNRGPDAVTQRKPLLTEKKAIAKQGGKKTYVLNKAFRDEFVSQAAGVSNGINGFKAELKRTINDMDNFEKRSRQENPESAKKGLANDLSSLTETYNKSSEFLKSQPYSAGLRTFSYEINDSIVYYKEDLSRLGLGLTENGKLLFNEPFFNKLSEKKVDSAIGKAKPIIDDLYKQTTDILSVPLADHLRIKNLNYHYNYKLGGLADEGFGLIESGMLIDRVV